MLKMSGWIKKTILKCSSLLAFLSSLYLVAPTQSEAEPIQSVPSPELPLEKQDLKKTKKYSKFSLEFGMQYPSFEPDDQLHESIEELYKTLRFTIKKWSSEIYPFAEAKFSPNDEWSVGVDAGFLIQENICGEGTITVLLEADTLFKDYIKATTNFQEFFAGINVKHYLNAESGRVYFGVGAGVISKKVVLDIKLDVYDNENNLLAFYDGTHKYYGKAYQLNAFFGTEFPIYKGINADFFINYVVEGKCTMNLESKIEKIYGLGANIFEERIDGKKGTVYVGAGINFSL